MPPTETFSQFAGIKDLEVLRNVGRVLQVENRSSVSGTNGAVHGEERYVIHFEREDGQRFHTVFKREVNTLAGHEACVLWYRFDNKSEWLPFAFADWNYGEGFVDVVARIPWLTDMPGPMLFMLLSRKQKLIRDAAEKIMYKG